MNNQIVQPEGNINIFPSQIPKKRQLRDVFAQIIICGVTFAVSCFYAKQNRFYFLCSSIPYNYLFNIIIEFVSRTCFLAEEWFHLESRYEGKLFELLKATFSVNNKNLIAIIIALCGLILNLILQGGPLRCIEIYGVPAWILSLAASTMLNKIMKQESCPLNIAKSMDDLKGLDYGSGMAYSYFYGYLNIILPCTGDERKGIKEHIEDYESKHGIRFGTKKLYILIPLSAYCPTNITDKSRIMERCDILQYHLLDRAGVKERQYHNSVYKIHETINERPIYVCAEYASPLLTFYEVTRQNTPESRRYKHYQREIVTNFFMTLDKIIKTSHDCRDICELIYYRDIDNSDNALPINQLDVGRLLLERIHQENSMA